MSISKKDIKRLWGKAGGRCSKCNIDLFIELEKDEEVNIGEMAHVIAKKKNGPRGSKGIVEDGRNSYSNLILLCRNCHKEIDESPDNYSVEEIKQLKKQHEKKVDANLSGEKYNDKSAMFDVIKKILMENKHIHEQYGPDSLVAQRNPMSDAKEMWDLKKVSELIPNNYMIINIISKNKNLLTREEYNIFLDFKTHAETFSKNTYERQDDELVKTFPESFEKMIFEE